VRFVVSSLLKAESNSSMPLFLLSLPRKPIEISSPYVLDEFKLL
jgi:hypothetical protein